MKNCLKILVVLFWVCNFQLFAQHADCDNMLILKDTIYQAQSISGFGSTKEFEGNELEDIKTFEEEKNSIWYFITAPADGVFTFDIISENESDDWDFLLYEYNREFCKRIEDEKIVPIRTNLSRSPITGLSRKGKENFIGAGINSNYSRPIHTHNGDRYVLVVNNPKRAKGNHTLVLHFPQEKKILDTTQLKEMPVEVVQAKFELIVKDKITGDLVKSNISITGLVSKSLVIDDKSVFIKYISKKNRTLSINSSAKGYMLSSLQFKIYKNQLMANCELLLEPIKSGARVNLKDIQFYGNRFDLLPSAKPSLEALLLFMNFNSTVVIEVEGHVNGPGQKNSKEYQELSYSRAYAVKDFLIKKGVAKERIDFKGYGNSQMLYTDPKSRYQEAANRRVEIKILSK
jgi:outer membrane protein OmpA-like peptidoglycan-associated protein